MTSQNFTATIQDVSSRLDRFLKRHIPDLLQSVIEKALRSSQIKVNGKKVKSSYRLEMNDVVSVYFIYSPSEAPFLEKKIELWSKTKEAEFKKIIVFEDENILVLNKPTGLAVQGGTQIIYSLDDALKERRVYLGCSYKLVHRLDKETSGVLIVAKTLIWAQYLTRLFKERTIEKVYRAVIVGIPKKDRGEIAHSLSKGVGSYKEKMIVDDEDGLSAVTKYRVLKTNAEKGLTLLEVYPESGRTHQIRVHMASIDCPILGDGKYGGRNATLLSRDLHLHAHKVTFKTPKGERKVFTVPQPSEWDDLIT